jgi:hypothetical protein
MRVRTPSASIHRHPALSGVDAHRDPVAKGLHELADERFTFHCAGADDRAADTQAQHALHRGAGAEPAAELHLKPAGDDRADRDQVRRLAAKRPVEVDHGHPRRAGRLEVGRHLRRIGGIHRLPVGAPLREADATPALEVDGRIDGHGRRR